MSELAQAVPANLGSAPAGGRRSLLFCLSHGRDMRRDVQRGFTLFEILVVVAIVGILSALLLPAYQSAVNKSRRADGRSALAEMASKQEKFFAQNNTYSTTVDTVGTGLGMGKTTSDKDFYSLTSAAGSCGAISRCYLLTATATGAQTSDEDCFKLTLDNTGRRRAYTKGGSDNTDVCW